ncbi:MAG: hypothetical protein ACRCT1_04540 [Microcoleaceae cyanobacterium]
MRKEEARRKALHNGDMWEAAWHKRHPPKISSKVGLAYSTIILGDV